MLHNQDFTQPPLILLGHEIFYDPESPHLISIERIADFVTQVCTTGRFTFIFVSRRTIPNLCFKPLNYYKTLLDYRVPFRAAHIINPLLSQHWRNLNHLLRLASFGYAPSLFSSPLVRLKNKCTNIEPEGVIEILKEAAVLPNVFDYKLFTSLLNQQNGKLV